MTDEAALLAAVVAHPDEDTPRLAYADWLDENRPDRLPSPAAAPSARAEYVRVQCRLAAGAFDDPDYPELLEREEDLAAWLNAHDPDPDPELPDLNYRTTFDAGDWGDYRRGFLERIDFSDYFDADDGAETVGKMVAALRAAFKKTPARTLLLVDATAEEVALLVADPVFARVRGLHLDGLVDGDEWDALTAVADSPRSAGLRRLYLDLPLDDPGCVALAQGRHLGNLESLSLDWPAPARAIKRFHGVRWFRHLRRLHLWTGNGEVFKALADLPPMRRLVSLTLSGVSGVGPAVVRKFAASGAFPRLAHLALSGVGLSPEHVAALCRGKWPLRHLDLAQNDVRKAGCEALACAPFARTLRVLNLRECDVTSGGVQALAGCGAFAGLRHLCLAGNPVGPAGLAALAASPHLRGLRALDLGRMNLARGPVAARHVHAFLSELDTPGLRHLRLDAMPVAVRGAGVLAESPTFANLTQLQLGFCSLGPRGTAALLGSANFGNLVYLGLEGNKVGSAAGKLADPKLFPRLGCCRLGTGVSKTVAARLARRPAVRL